MKNRKRTDVATIIINILLIGCRYDSLIQAAPYELSHMLDGNNCGIWNCTERSVATTDCRLIYPCTLRTLSISVPLVRRTARTASRRGEAASWSEHCGSKTATRFGSGDQAAPEQSEWLRARGGGGRAEGSGGRKRSPTG
jgi:hypothetical protein